MPRCNHCKCWISPGTVPDHCPDCGIAGPLDASLLEPGDKRDERPFLMKPRMGVRLDKATDFLNRINTRAGCTEIVLGIGGLCAIVNGLSVGNLAATCGGVAMIGLLLWMRGIFWRQLVPVPNPAMSRSEDCHQARLTALGQESCDLRAKLATLSGMLASEASVGERAGRRMELLRLAISGHEAKVAALTEVMHIIQAHRILQEFSGLLTELQDAPSRPAAESLEPDLIRALTEMTAWRDVAAIQNLVSRSGRAAVDAIDRVLADRESLLERLRDRRVLLEVGGLNDAAFTGTGWQDFLNWDDPLESAADLIPEAAQFDEEMIRINTELRLLAAAQPSRTDSPAPKASN